MQRLYREIICRKITCTEYKISQGQGRVLHQSFCKGFQHTIKMDPMDLRFCKNEGSKKSKTNEKGGQLDRKSRRKLLQNAYKVLNNTFC